MAKREDKITTRNVTEGSGGTRIDRDRYELMKAALLEVVPQDEAGIAFMDLADALDPLLKARGWPADASVMWYLTTVKLDLEARGLLERIPRKRPQHLRRP
jgi:hypothetical protein